MVPGAHGAAQDVPVEDRSKAGAIPPDISIVIPVNAQGDLENVQHVLADIAGYDGRLAVETILVVNNFPPGRVPPEVEQLRERAIVLAIPNVRKAGEAVAFSGRIQGTRVARSPYVFLTDADCRLRSPTALLDWYHRQLSTYAHAAYTHVDYWGRDPALSVRCMLAFSHAARWVKRVLFRIPITRGGSYGVRRDDLLKLYSDGMLADEMNVGPVFKRLVGPVAYGSGKDLHVLTSARMFRPGWAQAIPYFLYRLRYNLRVLPVRAGVAKVTGRENDPVRRYRDNRPIMEDL